MSGIGESGRSTLTEPGSHYSRKFTIKRVAVLAEVRAQKIAVFVQVRT